MTIGEYGISFANPLWLLLLLVMPLLWVFSFRSLSSLGNWRRGLVLLLRTAVLTLLVMALAEVQLVRVSDRVEVYYLLDQSKSIPESHRTLMLEFARSSVRQHRKTLDRAGVIVFGRDATIESPAFDDDIPGGNIETNPDPDHTNLASAMKLAQASFHEDAARRVVVVTDGNENLGDALEQAQALREAGVSIDVVPIRYRESSEVIVERVSMPADVRKGQPFDLRVVVNNTNTPTEGTEGNVSGRLVVRMKTDDQPVIISEQPLTLPPGKHVFTLRQTIDRPDYYNYEAVWVPDRPEDDGFKENNEGTAFTHIRGSGQVMVITNPETPGEHDYFVDRLRAGNIEVTVRPSNQLFTSLAELQQYDAIVLANVPKEDFSDEQIKMLVHNTEFLGAGLIMLGGEHSFGPGGWTNTDLEKAMPVDFQIKAAKVQPKGALAMIMHASEIPEGNYWQKVIAEKALEALGEQDYCGVVRWDGTDKWLWQHPTGMIKVGGNRSRMVKAIGSMVPGDMPAFDPGMAMARRGLSAVKDAAVKHLIIISDGDPSAATNATLQSFVDNQITVSTVAVGAHGVAEQGELKRIANRTGGKFYLVTNNKALPKIFQTEARRVARPLIYQQDQPFVPGVTSFHEMLSGIQEPLPGITAFVMTSKKDNPLVEVLLTSPVPASGENNTILASWNYGLGKAVAFTTDTGARWANSWTGWEGYDKFMTQMVRWAMRPVSELGKFTVATDVRDGKVRVVITALDKDDEFLNFLDMTGVVIDGEQKPHDLNVQQVAPGRYVGEFDADAAGNYFVLVQPGPGQAPIRAGVDVPYSAEFRKRGTNENLLTTIAALEPTGGKPGQLLDTLPVGEDQQPALAGFNPFRRDLPRATSSQDAWFVLAAIAACLFFADVLTRRVSLSFEWLAPVWKYVREKILKREAKAETTPYLQRLKSRKAEVVGGIEQQRASTRFEPEPEIASRNVSLEEQLAAPPPSGEKKPSEGSPGVGPEKEQESYTARLMKAKKRAIDDRKP